MNLEVESQLQILTTLKDQQGNKNDKIVDVIEKREEQEFFN